MAPSPPSAPTLSSTVLLCLLPLPNPHTPHATPHTPRLHRCINNAYQPSSSPHRPPFSDIYYIVSGVQYPEGAVLARDRKGVAHDWRMDQTPHTPGGNVQGDFWVGITNYDLNVPIPPADDRSTPMTDNLNALEGKEFSDAELWTVLKTWPTMNMHTDISAMIDVVQGSFDVLVWFDHGAHVPTADKV